MAASGVVVTVGGIFMAVTAFEPSNPPPSVWANAWFDAGFAFVVIGLAVLAIGLFLHFRPSTPAAGLPPASEPDPADWIAGWDETEDHNLVFTLRHRFDNLAAIMAFGAYRCTVTDPGGVTTTASGAGRIYQYHPYSFPGAPPVRSGTYRFVWEGQDGKGVWYEIVRGTHDVNMPPLLVRLKEPPQWENWKYVAMIAAFHVEIRNTTDRPIMVGSYAFTTDNRGLPDWESTAIGEEHIGVHREIHARHENHHYGPQLRLHSEVPAHESVSGWFVTAVTRDPAGGTPECSIIVKDDIGNEYQLTVGRQDPQMTPT